MLIKFYDLLERTRRRLLQSIQGTYLDFISECSEIDNLCTQSESVQYIPTTDDPRSNKTFNSLSFHFFLYFIRQ